MLEYISQLKYGTKSCILFAFSSLLTIFMYWLNAMIGFIDIEVMLAFIVALIILILIGMTFGIIGIVKWFKDKILDWLSIVGVLLHIAFILSFPIVFFALMMRP